MDTDSPTLVDLFSGCGGLALGFHQSGFKTVLANDLHPDPATTYVRNLMPESPEVMRVGDVVKQLSPSRLAKWVDGIDYDVDCVAGGPPCQGFSMAGRSDPEDPRNHLFRDFLRVTAGIMPKTVVFENVPGFANRYGMKLRDKLHAYLEKCGYRVCSGVLVAKDFGVPQLRKRFFAIGVREDVIGSEELLMPTPTFRGKKQRSELTCERVIGDLDTYQGRGDYGSGTIHGDWEYRTWAKGRFQREMRVVSGRGPRGSTWNTRIPAHQPRVVQRMGRILAGASNEDFEGTDLQTAKLSQRALSGNSVPNITIVSIPDDYIHYNKEMPRTLSVRECARFQTFPDHFHFHGKRTSGGDRRKVDVPQYTQVANAIPPRLAEAVADSLLTFL